MPNPHTNTTARTGVLLINLGTPEAPTPSAVRAYLREFLSDPRVVEIPRLLWLPILYGIILPLRASKSAQKYASIWEKEGSPLKIHTEKAAKLLRGYLAREDLVVTYAMRYGHPSISRQLDELTAAGCSKILLIPLYPQYSATTTAAAFDAAFDWAKTRRNVPALQTIKSYADHSAYIAALAAHVRQFWRTQGIPPSAEHKLIFSFHGIPVAATQKGDPYHQECLTTGHLLAETLGLNPHQYVISFQSRFGKAKWLTPYTAETLQSLAATGVKSVDIFCPGFPCDCLETLEEIAIEGKALFQAAGGQHFRFIPCLNESEYWIHALKEIVQTELS